MLPPSVLINLLQSNRTHLTPKPGVVMTTYPMTLCKSVNLANQSHFSGDNTKMFDVKGMSKSCMSSVNEEYLLHCVVSARADPAVTSPPPHHPIACACCLLSAVSVTSAPQVHVQITLSHLLLIAHATRVPRFTFDLCFPS